MDFVVELVGADAITPYFFVQVKTTRDGYTKKDRRLKVQVKRDALQRLTSYPAPTYIVGIDEIAETAYIVSANGEWLGDMSSLSTEHPIDKNNQDLLWEEVNGFWARSGKAHYASRFIDSKWR